MGGTAPEFWRGVPMLYAEARLARRFEAFETLCLPSIKAQTDPDFSFWILTSPELPAVAERLRALRRHAPDPASSCPMRAHPRRRCARRCAPPPTGGPAGDPVPRR
jgi:hypothetical protein